MADELTALSTTASIKPQSQQRNNPNDIRNADLVSRFLAATPPYLYSPPVGPHNFFFSDMLRSLVQSKTNEQTTRNLSPFTRRPRKRSWSRCMFDSHQINPKELKETVEKSAIEKPLELTNKLTANHFAISALSPRLAKDNNVKLNDADKKLAPIVANAVNDTSNEPTTASLPPSDLILPPPPPMWYPPLYPPYGIDPLHFFIDLRVSASGHIYDRKKENISPSANGNNNENNNTSKLDDIGKTRHGSAFSVPPPRREKSPLALNLSSSTCSSMAEKNPLIDYRNTLYLEPDRDSMKNPKNTNYVLQNLPRIYTTMMPPHNNDRQSVISDGSDSKSESDLAEVDVKADDVVIVDCQDTDESMTDNNNPKCGSY